jgi:hypothetical protein
MSEPTVAYKGCTIEVESYQSDGGRWRAGAVVITAVASGRVQTRKIPDLTPTTFATKAEADEWAITLAKQWIDATVILG